MKAKHQPHGTEGKQMASIKLDKEMTENLIDLRNFSTGTHTITVTKSGKQVLLTGKLNVVK